MFDYHEEATSVARSTAKRVVDRREMDEERAWSADRVQSTG
jgi:hypothetical protein